MPALQVEISRFIDEHQPGFVECTLVDANGQCHLFVEKVPIVSKEDLWSTSSYPRSGLIECEIEEEEMKTESGLPVFRVSTEKPWGVESTTGQTQFLVKPSQVVR